MPKAVDAKSVSLGLGSHRLLRWLIRFSQGTRFGPAMTPQTFELTEGSGDGLSSGQAEFDGGSRFFAHFRGGMSSEDLAGCELLDLGCGYGGRTVYYVSECAAARATGLEISSKMVDRCEAFAAARGCDRATFMLGFAEKLRFDDRSFDAVVSYDVLEHVQDPRAAFREIRRVLRPGGRAWLVFPTYLGARASHLDYVTRLPALHRLFDPKVIVDVVNEFLREAPELYGTAPQPEPSVSVFGRVVLPTLNGMTLDEARASIAGARLRVELEEITAIVEPDMTIPGAQPLARSMAAWQRRFGLPELLVGSIAYCLTPDDGSLNRSSGA